MRHYRLRMKRKLMAMVRKTMLRRFPPRDRYRLYFHLMVESLMLHVVLWLVDTRHHRHQDYNLNSRLPQNRGLDEPIAVMVEREVRAVVKET